MIRMSDQVSTRSAEERADRLKERIYITFTALAVVLALRSHAESTGAVARTLLIAVVGTLLAVFVADVVSHIAVHAAFPRPAELRHIAGVSSSALGVLVLPMIFIGLAALDVWTLDGALRASTIALIAALAAAGWLAVRRVRLPRWQKLVVLFAEVVLGVVVVLLELWAHG
ncbi:hypothetical protein [Nakamurella leprariae]|uniref:Uncharacterized protein n=1 Tax=Nakamurella leprariae TaxID=2803911 RepID=A0A938YEK9_9ACTN|nr:hypothetical protein [Nakamurella leprariae]MBM9468163.1 hypothetical protein [Nakamurella leprariae]